MPCDPAISLLGVYTEKTMIQKDTGIPMFTAALFTIAKTWKQPKCATIDELIKETWCVYIYAYTYTMEYYSVIKRMK